MKNAKNLSNLQAYRLSAQNKILGGGDANTSAGMSISKGGSGSNLSESEVLIVLGIILWTAAKALN